MKTNIFFFSFLLFNLLIINEITAQTPIRFRLENGNIGLYDEVNHKVLTKESYLRINAFSEGVACAVVSDGADGLMTYLNEKGEKIGAQTYPMNYGECKNGLIPVKIGNNKYEYINKTGKKAFEGTFYDARNFSEGYAVVSKTVNDVGFIDVNGKFCFEKQLQNIQKISDTKSALTCGSFRGGVTLIEAVEHRKKYILNNKGNIFDMSATIEKVENNTLFPNKIEKPLFTYDERGSHFVYGMTNTGTFTVKSYIGIFMFDEKNKFVGNFESIESIGNKRFLVRKSNNQSYFADINGKKLAANIPSEGLYNYNSVYDYNEDYIILQKASAQSLDNSYSVFDKNLKEIKVKMSYNYANQLNTHIITLENGVQIINGFYNTKRFLVSSVPVDNVLLDEDKNGTMNVSELDFPVVIKNKGRFGLINQQGKMLIPCEYDQMETFEGNYFTTATKNGKKMKITRNNKVID